jgi:hypothetical protein
MAAYVYNEHPRYTCPRTYQSGCFSSLKLFVTWAKIAALILNIVVGFDNSILVI